MSIQEKFQAAVNVIRSLPKNGPYQPSNDLMLRFYGYFKQATEGPCKGARPNFFNIVGRAKYDAWKKLEDMPSEEAMTHYVEELHQIVETMSYSDNVAHFVNTTGDLDLPLEDVELVFGDVIKRVKSQNSSPIASRNVTPNKSSDDSDEEFADTLEVNNDGNHATSYQHRKLKSYDSLTLIYESNQVILKTMQEMDRKLRDIDSKIRKFESQLLKSSEPTKPKLNFKFVSNLISSPTIQLVSLIILWPILQNILKRRMMTRHR